MSDYAATPGAHVNAGKTLLEIIWEDLDRVMDILMEGIIPQYPNANRTLRFSWKQQAEEWQAYGEERGQAQGLAYAIAVLTNPYHVDVDNIRLEAMKRWQQRTEEK